VFSSNSTFWNEASLFLLKAGFFDLLHPLRFYS